MLESLSNKVAGLRALRTPVSSCTLFTVHEKDTAKEA